MVQLDFDRDSVRVFLCQIRLTFTIYAYVELERYYHFYGHSYARLSLGVSVHEEQQKPISSFGYFLSFLLFHVPLKRLDMVNKAFVDHMVQRIAFADFTERIVDSWQAEIINVGKLIHVLDRID